MTGHPRVSVVMATFNRAQFLDARLHPLAGSALRLVAAEGPYRQQAHVPRTEDDPVRAGVAESRAGASRPDDERNRPTHVREDQSRIAGHEAVAVASVRERVAERGLAGHADVEAAPLLKYRPRIESTTRTLASAGRRRPMTQSFFAGVRSSLRIRPFQSWK